MEWASKRNEEDEVIEKIRDDLGWPGKSSLKDNLKS